jgi:hydroxypyruvate reductase
MTALDQIRRDLLAIFAAALAAVHGRQCVRTALQARPPGGDAYVLALGKAAVPMMQGAMDVLGTGIRDALIVTKDAAGVRLPYPLLESGHPLPDARSLAAGERVLAFVAALPPGAPVLVLLSGGASALVEALAPTLDLGRLRDITQWMLASGLDIDAMNRIRKRMSRLKGGRLAKLLYPRPVRCLAISDVPGDDARAIGSGPLVAETGSEPELAHAPEFVRTVLQHAPPLPPADDPCFTSVDFSIVATLDDARRAAAQAAAGLGRQVVIEPEFIAGEACIAGEVLVQRLLAAPPGVVHIWGGETTVTLPSNPGRGGRNQSLALAAALRLQGQATVALLAAGTDGTDGPTEDAGALVDSGTVARGALSGLDAQAALTAADAGTFLAASGDLVHTGPTGTNVMDLMIGLRKA